LAASKKTRKKSARTKSRGLGASLDRELAQLSKRIDRDLKQLGRSIDRAQIQAGREAARLVGQARTQLSKAEVRGNSEWENFLRKSQRDLVGLLGRLERAVRPKRKKATRKKRATRKKA